jgi:hypothetical protein
MCIADCCGEELMKALSQLSRIVNATGPEGGTSRTIAEQWAHQAVTMPGDSAGLAKQEEGRRWCLEVLTAE